MKGGEIMSIQKMKEQTFPRSTLQDWLEVAEKSLKGKKVDDFIYESYEQISIKPLYTEEDEMNITDLPGEGDGRRGYEPLGYIKNPWKIAQQLIVPNERKLFDVLRDAIKRGQTALSFQVNGKTAQEVGDLESLAYEYPFALNGKKYFNEVMERVKGFSESFKLTGYIGQDPISLFAQEGEDFDFLSESEKFYETVSDFQKITPNVRTIFIDIVPYHQGGAHVVQELAIALSEGVYQIEQLKKKGWTVESIFPNIVFQFPIGNQFFLEVSKLRAARVLWSKICEAYRMDPFTTGKMVISAVTSPFTKTIYDPYVNMLRAGNEAFAAILGGIQYLHVSPFNEPEGVYDDFAQRIARNTQLILKEEAHLTKTVDPAGGSWYVEYLTNELVKKAWSLFLDIEDRGGILQALQTNWLQREIKQVLEKKEKEVLFGEQSIVGTNKYFDEKIKPLNILLKTRKEKGIPERRLTEKYEINILKERGGEND